MKKKKIEFSKLLLMQESILINPCLTYLHNVGLVIPNISKTSFALIILLPPVSF